jgi:hypothetical protein
MYEHWPVIRRVTRWNGTGAAEPSAFAYIELMTSAREATMISYSISRVTVPGAF